MTYFKIIKKDKVINVGCVFLKWNENKNKMNICEVDDAQFVQTYDESAIYKAGWLNPAPKKAGKFETVQVVVIDETEFNDLLELLSEGEQISVEEEEHEEYQPRQTETEEPEEKPLTIAEMREMIIEQQKQIEALIEKLQD